MNPPNYRSMTEGEDKEARYDFRLRLVRHAQEHGLRATAQMYRCSRNTVRLWLRRYEGREPDLGSGPGALVEKTRAPHRIPHKTPPEEEAKVIAARKKVPNCGPDRLKEWFELAPSPNAIGRILKERGLTKRKRKKREKQTDLREIKAQYPALTHLQMDVRYLWDIPQYWPHGGAGSPKVRVHDPGYEEQGDLPRLLVIK